MQSQTFTWPRPALRRTKFACVCFLSLDLLANGPCSSSTLQKAAPGPGDSKVCLGPRLGCHALLQDPLPKCPAQGQERLVQGKVSPCKKVEFNSILIPFDKKKSKTKTGQEKCAHHGGSGRGPGRAGRKCQEARLLPPVRRLLDWGVWIVLKSFV